MVVCGAHLGPSQGLRQTVGRPRQPSQAHHRSVAGTKRPLERSPITTPRRDFPSSRASAQLRSHNQGCHYLVALDLMAQAAQQQEGQLGQTPRILEKHNNVGSSSEQANNVASLGTLSNRLMSTQC
ncbi:hypothetical protein PCANC_04094 [Puccinia coronata f. sp. avenae]|uniref:Uncharacterized protein n=1 Tax=Puccinia coronata f. sp. avenae TaxID=200324 RepID=A0A2N5V498_9BASI|nr:hypothetical protein PCANC_18899 [Puccinia coronata f. sp. avenae]PLW44832.1 hypothetical protein PCASD_07099 [Puccinia coronata f. sp. avenae]PLW56282.1 hypothetical protein PCANC_04094 [Puccinia coronata f. sp. avenae]